ncbi:MAG: methyl-accepting chemotaxis protein [Candidatus Sericytochromatia bacterium]|nr:methyl-accepting chemotaxis protein [Candidatus Sericytochromatia bacterium]
MATLPLGLFLFFVAFALQACGLAVGLSSGGAWLAVPPVAWVGLATVALLVAFAASWLYRRRWEEAAQRLAGQLQAMGEGDLKPVDHGRLPPGLADVAEKLGETRAGLVQWVQDAQGASGSLVRLQEDLQGVSERGTRGARGLSGQSQRVLEMVAKQSDLIRDTISSLMAFEAVIQSAERHTVNAEQLYRRTHDTVTQAKDSLDKLLDAITDLRNSVHRSTDGVVELSREVLSIGDIVQTVHNIAKKTNLLAINAGIAAAQAGEKGQGFAIIADEIRSLATQTSSALASIQDILLRVQGRTKEVASAIGVGTRKVSEGETAAKDAGRAIAETRTAMGRSTDQVTEILKATAQIRSASDRLVETLTIVSNLSEETQKGTKQMASQGEDQVRALAEVSGAVGALAGQTRSLEKLIGRFQRA